MAFKLDEVIAVLNESGVPPDKVNIVRTELEELEKEKKEERAENKEPKAKNQFVIVLNDSSNVLVGGKVTLENLTGWVLQLREGDDPVTAIDRVKRAAKQQNTKIKKFVKAPLKSFGDAVQNLRRAFTKAEGVHVKTKEEVRVLLSDNSL